MTRALYTIMVAVIAMLAVPVSQLRIASVRVECCCPNPAKCQCNDHEETVPGQVTIKACHKSTEIIASASSSDFKAPSMVPLSAPSRRVAIAQFAVRLPHEPPAPARPPGPS